MKAIFQPCRLRGVTEAPPSKSLAHRYLIGAALSGQRCTLWGVDLSEDILATVDCLRALGADVTVEGDRVSVDPCDFLRVEEPILNCRESGSTLRFLLPLALCSGRPVTLRGSERLMERPLEIYEELCRERGFLFQRDGSSVTVCGRLTAGRYRVRGDVSSQFITGLLFALSYLGGGSSLELIPPVESRPYLDLTVQALSAFGAPVAFAEDCVLEIGEPAWRAFSGTVEGDCSNAAFLEAFNRLGAEIRIGNLNPHTLQGDRVYASYFDALEAGAPTLDLSDCPDLAPILFALAALKEGATFTGTDRLRLKESDRGAAMHEELSRLGGGLLFGDNRITVPKQELRYAGEPLDGHNDHRVVMALSVVLSRIGGTLCGVEAVKKSYPAFFEVLRSLGAEVELV